MISLRNDPEEKKHKNVLFLQLTLGAAKRQTKNNKKRKDN